MNPLAGKNILIGISGGIAAFKVPYLVRRLKEKDANVDIVMTENATRFISPTLLSSISDNVYTTLWDQGPIHIKLAHKSDCMVIVPADFNIMGKAASGIADDLLSTVISAFYKDIIFFPSMHESMYDNPVLQNNIQKLIKNNHTVIQPEEGPLASGDTGKGRLPDISKILLEVEKILSPSLLKDKKCLITCGATAEPVDPVRFISNRSSGKMGIALARSCYLAGGLPEIIMGINDIKEDIPFPLVKVENSDEMYREILKKWDDINYLFMAAAVSDFKVESYKEKIKKKEEFTLKLKKNIDIISELNKRKKKQTIIGFSIESENLLQNSKKKRKEKGVDMIIANEISAIGSHETSGYIISADDNEKFECTKDELSWKILKKINSLKL